MLFNLEKNFYNFYYISGKKLCYTKFNEHRMTGLNR